MTQESVPSGPDLDLLPALALFARGFRRLRPFVLRLSTCLRVLCTCGLSPCNAWESPRLPAAPGAEP